MNLFQNKQDIIYLWNLHLSWERKTEEESGSLTSVQLLSHVQLLACDPMDCGTPGFPVHQLLELTQTHVHRVSNAIQPSHPWLQTILQSYSDQNTTILAQRVIDQWNRIKKKPRNTPTYLWSIRETRTYNGEKTISSISGAGKTGQLLVK